MNHLFKQLVKLTFPIFLLQSEHDLIFLVLVKRIFLFALLDLLIETSTLKQNSYFTACSTQQNGWNICLLQIPFSANSALFSHLPSASRSLSYSPLQLNEVSWALNLPHAGHCDRYWKITVTQAYLIFHLKTESLLSIDEPLPHMGAISLPLDKSHDTQQIEAWLPLFSFTYILFVYFATIIFHNIAFRGQGTLCTNRLPFVARTSIK